jgi:hypothetical protein
VKLVELAENSGFQHDLRWSCPPALPTPLAPGAGSRPSRAWSPRPGLGINAWTPSLTDCARLRVVEAPPRTAAPFAEKPVANLQRGGAPTRCASPPGRVEKSRLDGALERARNARRAYGRPAPAVRKLWVLSGKEGAIESQFMAALLLDASMERQTA